MAWFENLNSKEIPPEHIWDDSEGLSDWWDHVKEKREREYGHHSVPDDEDMEDNQLATQFKR